MNFYTKLQCLARVDGSGGSADCRNDEHRVQGPSEGNYSAACGSVISRHVHAVFPLSDVWHTSVGQNVDTKTYVEETSLTTIMSRDVR